MKKVLSLVLVAVLALGMGISAFAEWDSAKNKFTSFENGYTLADGIYENTSNNQTYNMGTVHPMDEPEIIINLYKFMFGVEAFDNINSDYTQYRYYKLNVDALARDGIISSTDATRLKTYDWENGTTAWADLFASIEDRNSTASQKFFVNYIARNYILNTRYASATNADGNRVSAWYLDDISSSVVADGIFRAFGGTSSAAGYITTGNTASKGVFMYSSVNGSNDGYTGPTVASIPTGADPDDYVALTNGTFAHSNDFAKNSNHDYAFSGFNTLKESEAVDARENVTSQQITNSKFSYGLTVTSGSQAMKSHSLKKADGYIKIELQDELVRTSELDFTIRVYPTFDGKRDQNAEVTIEGTLENPELEVYSDDDYVDISKGYVAVAEEFVNKIEVDLGNGVSIFTKFFKGKKYYGISTRDADDDDDIVFTKYPDVDNVVTIKSVGLNSTGDIVKLDTDYSNYYVYDKDMNYLGQSNEMLPFSAKYYLANKKLDVDDGDDDEDYDDDDDDDEAPDDGGSNPGTGGDGSIPNANANPGTGR